MSRQLSLRESAALRAMAARRRGADGEDLVLAIRERMAYISRSPENITLAGAHQTAASLVRKELAWRMGTKPQTYRVTEWGRRALMGDVSGQWVAR